MDNRPSPLVLLVIDGYGLSDEAMGNAILNAETPTMDELFSKYPSVVLKASGTAVGLPSGTMGNSEVGHLTIGIGSILYQSYERINQAIKNDELRQIQAIGDIIKHLTATGGNLHLFGLLSDGGVHSHINHLYALLEIFDKELNEEIWIHAFTDGRDVPPTSAYTYIESLIGKLKKYKRAKLADIVGRYYAMDRDKRWDRVKIAYDMITGSDRIQVQDPLGEISNRYNSGENDEFLRPIVVDKDGRVKNGDAILFFNFRPDRARQLTTLFTSREPPIEVKQPSNLYYATMTEYDEKFKLPVLFPPQKSEECLAKVYADSGLKQIHIAETEKYAHVTYFINGGVEQPFPNEKRIMVPSNKSVPTYDHAPEMSTLEIASEVVKAIHSKENGKHMYDLVVFNIAAPDMVGHTGNYEATIKAVETTDKAVRKVFNTAEEEGYIFAITADHGNAEKMLNNGAPHTAHTTNKVPFIITREGLTLEEGGLSNVAPTLLKLVGLPIPEKMSSSPLF